VDVETRLGDSPWRVSPFLLPCSVCTFCPTPQNGCSYLRPGMVHDVLPIILGTPLAIVEGVTQRTVNLASWTRESGSVVDVITAEVARDRVTVTRTWVARRRSSRQVETVSVASWQRQIDRLVAAGFERN
jgi:hypothetical protein